MVLDEGIIPEEARARLSAIDEVIDLFKRASVMTSQQGKVASVQIQLDLDLEVSQPVSKEAPAAKF